MGSLLRSESGVPLVGPLSPTAPLANQIATASRRGRIESAAFAREAKAHQNRLPGSSRALPLGARGFMLARVLSLFRF